MSKRFALKKQEKRKNKGEGKTVLRKKKENNKKTNRKTVLRVKRIIIW